MKEWQDNTYLSAIYLHWKYRGHPFFGFKELVKYALYQLMLHVRGHRRKPPIDIPAGTPLYVHSDGTVGPAPELSLSQWSKQPIGIALYSTKAYEPVEVRLSNPL